MEKNKTKEKVAIQHLSSGSTTARLLYSQTTPLTPQQRVKGAPKTARRAKLELKQQFPQVHGQNTDSIAAAFHRDCGNLSASRRCFCLHVYQAAPAVTLARP